MCEAISGGASPATELLAAKGALPYRHEGAVPDYWAELPENKAPRGRVLFPKGGNRSMRAKSGGFHEKRLTDQRFAQLRLARNQGKGKPLPSKRPCPATARFCTAGTNTPTTTR
ncbi:hypothetical protein [Paraburkholderia sp. LEh10]|uniref:hypothetical protein n=1 Tax=Paraburkholderia sp. LEh10 TaxID=2821353 RepID=UPI001FD796CD|nr:hypothetical protein [Paraburkholderia sp. LEh10]